MDENKLVLALRNQDPSAVRDLVASYGDRLFRSACLLCGDPAEAQDLVQETFVQAVQSASRFRGSSSLYTWLHSILVNLTRHFHRDRKWLVYGEDPPEEIHAADEQLNTLDLELSSSALAQALNHLSAPHREVVVLRFYEDMKVHEIASHLGISAGTVKSRLHYALEELERLLPNELNLFGPSGTKEMTKK